MESSIFKNENPVMLFVKQIYLALFLATEFHKKYKTKGSDFNNPEIFNRYFNCSTCILRKDLLLKNNVTL